MKAIVNLCVARPRTTLAVWLVVVAGLGVAGLKIEQQLHLTNPTVPGTTAAKAQSQAGRLFGQESTLAVLLTGGERQLNAGGPRVAAALARIPYVSVVSPWQAGMPRSLRPDRHNAVVLLGVRQPFEDVGKQTVPVIQLTLARTAPPSVKHHLTGYADLAAGIERASFAALKQAELIAAPLLFILLLFVFRSPVAASVPLFLGFSSVASSRGLLAGLNGGVLALDSSALSLASMFGLALGVDYSLLLVSRFREQLAEGAEPAEAARIAGATAGRTVLVAGFALGAGMTAGYFVAPGRILSSGSVGGLAGVIVSVLGAITAVPALLTLLGPRVNRWQFGHGMAGAGVASFAWRLITRPALAGGLVAIMLLALASQALSVKVSPPNDASLPPGSSQLKDLQALGTRLGGGWITPYEVIIHARHGLITDPRVLSALAAWEGRLEKQRSVAAVVGPQAVYGGEGPPSGQGSFASRAEIGLELLRDAPPEQRGAASIAVNLDRGGTAMRMEVIERTKPAAALSGDHAAIPGDPLRSRLVEQAQAIAAQTGTQIYVGGPAAELQDFTTASQQRLPLLILVLSLVTFLVLLVVMRSVPVALAAVALNVLTVCAALGVLVLGFQHSSVFGREGPLDAIITPAVISVAFGLAIDYEVFLLARIREGIAITGDTDEGLRYALDRTAGIITGAALIMCSVFLAFASANLINLREYGIGLTVAVLLDATVVRLVLLPMIIRLLGPRAWWIPAWLERLVGRWHLESPAERPTPQPQPAAIRL